MVSDDDASAQSDSGENQDAEETPGAPVFVDTTGRRKRILRRVGYVVAALCVAYVAMLGVSLAGGPVAPHSLLPIPGMPRAKPKPTPTPVQFASPQGDLPTITTRPTSLAPRPTATRTTTASPTTTPTTTSTVTTTPTATATATPTGGAGSPAPTVSRPIGPRPTLVPPTS